MKGEIIVSRTGDIKKVLPRIAGKKLAWLYLGQNIKQREGIARVLGKEKRYFIGNLLQETALKERKPFLDFIAELGQKQKNKRHWWASNIAYRSPLVSNFFLMWCYATIFDEVSFQNKHGQADTFLICVEDRWLYRHLWQRYKRHDNSPTFLSRKSIVPELLKLIAAGIFSRAFFIKRTAFYIRQLNNVPIRKKTSIPTQDKEHIYIYSWIRDSFFKDDGRFKSPYFGSLPDIISDNNLNVVYITELFPPMSTRSLLNQNKNDFFFPGQYLSFWSMIRSSMAILCITSFMSSPMKFLLLREMALEFASFPGNIVEYYAFKAWLNEMRPERLTIVYPFENQPWDKMLCLAAKESGKDIKLIGYQHSTVPLTLLNFFPGSGESANMPLPSIIVTNGEYTLNLLETAGYGDVKFVNGGAHRYEYIHKINRVSMRENITIKTILVAMSYSYTITQEMLLSLFDSFREPNRQDLKFLIKFHPEVPLESLPIQPPVWPAHFQKTVIPISQLLKETNLVIYSASTVGLEALLAGVPVVRYYSEHAIDLDPLDAFDENMIKSCSERNMRQVVISMINKGTGQTPQTAISDIDKLNKFFSPVKEDVWLKAIKN